MQHEDGQSAGEGQGANEVAQIDVQKLIETNKRLLEESNRHKKRAQELEKQRETEEVERVNKSGDLQKQLEMKNKMLEKMQSDLKLTQQKTLESNIRAAVAKFSDQIVSVDDVLNQPKYADILNTGIDRENLTVNDDYVKQYVDAVLQEKPFLKKQVQQVGVVTKKPSSFDPSAGQKSVRDMKPDELKRFILENYRK
jgi:hypothetical protein